MDPILVFSIAVNLCVCSMLIMQSILLKRLLPEVKRMSGLMESLKQRVDEDKPLSMLTRGGGEVEF